MAKIPHRWTPVLESCHGGEHWKLCRRQSGTFIRLFSSPFYRFLKIFSQQPLLSLLLLSDISSQCILNCDAGIGDSLVLKIATLSPLSIVPLFSIPPSPPDLSISRRELPYGPGPAQGFSLFKALFPFVCVCVCVYFTVRPAGVDVHEEQPRLSPHWPTGVVTSEPDLCLSEQRAPPLTHLRTKSWNRNGVSLQISFFKINFYSNPAKLNTHTHYQHYIWLQAKQTVICSTTNVNCHLDPDDFTCVCIKQCV